MNQPEPILSGQPAELKPGPKTSQSTLPFQSEMVFALGEADAIDFFYDLDAESGDVSSFAAVFAKIQLRLLQLEQEASSWNPEVFKAYKAGFETRVLAILSSQFPFNA